jgi:hypothetical protein
MYNIIAIKAESGTDLEKIGKFNECVTKYDAVLDSIKEFYNSASSIKSVYKNNHNLLKAEDKCSKDVQLIESDKIKAVYSKISEFNSVNFKCKDMITISERTFKDFDATFLYYIAGTFPTDEALTDTLHKKLAEDYSTNEGVKKLILASKAYLNVYAWKCEKTEHESVKKIQGYFNQIFDKDNNVNPLGTVDDIIAGNKCTETIDKLTTGNQLKNLLSKKVDWNNIFFQIQKKGADGELEEFEELCMTFSSDHTKLENIDRQYEGYDLDDRKTCSDIKRFIDPIDRTKPFENKEEINFLSLSEKDNAELFQDCGMSLGDSGSSLSTL